MCFSVNVNLIKDCFVASLNNLYLGLKDCFVASLLAMTMDASGRMQENCNLTPRLLIVSR